MPTGSRSRPQRFWFKPRNPGLEPGPDGQFHRHRGRGRVLAGANATSSSATDTGAVMATTGSVNLTIGSATNANGNVTIQANNQSVQSAQATGVAVGGILAIGIDIAQASSGVNTSAQLGAGTITNITGTLAVLASGSDTNDVSSTAGSGGVIAGDAAIGNTSDTSTVMANLAGGTLIAGTVQVAATNGSTYAPLVNSVNAALVGVSGAGSTNSESTTANAVVNNGTDIIASNAVSVTAQNTINEFQSGISAGAGGVFNGTAAKSVTTVSSTSGVTIGNSVQIMVMTASSQCHSAQGLEGDHDERHGHARNRWRDRRIEHQFEPRGHAEQ